GFCLTRLNVLAQVSCLWLRSFAETYNRVYKVASRTSLGADCLRVQPANNSRCRLLLGAAQRSRAGRLAGWACTQFTYRVGGSRTFYLATPSSCKIKFIHLF